jgi:hypothetical protein
VECVPPNGNLLLYQGAKVVGSEVPKVEDLQEGTAPLRKIRPLSVTDVKRKS